MAYLDPAVDGKGEPILYSRHAPRFQIRRTSRRVGGRVVLVQERIPLIRLSPGSNQLVEGRAELEPFELTPHWQRYLCGQS